jgi:hypothetical protein
MLASNHLGDGSNESIPAITLLREHFSAVARQLVDASAPLACLFDPAPFDPAALFELIEEGIKGCRVKVTVPPDRCSMSCAIS